MEYAGRLRFPPDVTAEQRRARVEEVLAELDIADRSASSIGELSGGERKRTNVALELLTKPSLLFLDEPVSGLDPGLARVLMLLLRRLADDGREVVVVTHEISNLSICDQVLVLAPGGVPAYVGPPAGAAERFGESDIAEVFTDLSTGDPAGFRMPAPPEIGVAGPRAGQGPRTAPLPPPCGSARTWR